MVTVRKLCVSVVIIGFLAFCWYVGNLSPLAKSQQELEQVKQLNTQLQAQLNAAKAAATQPKVPSTSTKPANVNPEATVMAPAATQPTKTP